MPCMGVFWVLWSVWARGIKPYIFVGCLPYGVWTPVQKTPAEEPLGACFFVSKEKRLYTSESLNNHGWPTVVKTL